MPDTTAVEPPPLYVTIFPGDVAQITQPGHRFFGGFVMVETVRNWGFQGFAAAQGEEGPAHVPMRIEVNAFTILGMAALMPPEIAAARKAAVATAKEYFRERGDRNDG